METTLHRQLKDLYAGEPADQEVAVERFRIDAVGEGRLIEVQCGSLGAIRDKVRTLLERHEVLVVKPLAARKRLVRRATKDGPIESARYSPLRETLFDLFADLVHFVGVFPHPRLTLEVVLTEQEEHRLPARRRRRRRFSRDYHVEDRTLQSIQERSQFRTAGDLAALLPPALPDPFSTADLAQAAGIPRWLAQKMAYCLRQTASVTPVAKQRNGILYCRSASVQPRKRRRGRRAEPA